jgi:hypothetical protein
LEPEPVEQHQPEESPNLNDLEVPAFLRRERRLFQ